MAKDTATTIKSSIVDGIALTPRFRERTLVSLHSTLENARAEILEEIQRSADTTNEEALFEYLLTLNAIKTFHSTVHPQTCKNIEYRIAQSKDHPDHRRPYGYVYIMRADNEGFYSTIVAVAAGLAAGNCILVQQHADSTEPTYFERLLTKALSSEVFALVSEDPFESTFIEQYRVILQRDQQQQSCTRSNTIQLPTGHNVAIVDRTADLKAAARDCVHARFAFGGTSAYAPDFVLVNEFYIKEFASAVASAALQYLTSQANGHPTPKSKPSQQTSTPATPPPSFESATTLASGAKGKVLLQHTRTTTLLTTKTTTPTLILLPITSVDDAIDFLNTSPSCLSAVYIYSNPSFAKYTAQFLRSSLVLVNHIPAELLVGPGAPLGFAARVHPRYTPEMFSVSSPAFIEESTSTRLGTLQDAIWPDPTSHSTSASRREKGRGDLKTLIETSLTPVSEPFGPKVGFFEQGLLLGASLIVSTAVVGVVLCVKFGWRGYLALSR